MIGKRHSTKYQVFAINHPRTQLILWQWLEKCAIHFLIIHYLKKKIHVSHVS